MDSRTHRVTTLEMMTDENGITGEQCGIKFSLASTAVRDEKDLKLAPCTRYLARMIPIPDGYRLATAEDRKRHKPEGTRILARFGRWAEAHLTDVWGAEYTYCVPIEPETVEVQILGKKKTITLAQAKSLGLVD